MYDFAYQKPSSLADAVKALGADPEAKALAGGMTLIPVLKQRLNKPSVVVDLAKLGLTGVSVADAIIIVGGMTTHSAVSADANVKAKIPALAELASHIGDEAVRHRGTIGGSLANNDPAADYPAAALALGATIKTTAARSRPTTSSRACSQQRWSRASSSPRWNSRLPRRRPIEKFRNPASRYAIVGVFVAKTAGGVRVAVTGAGQNGVFRHTAMEQALSANFSPGAIANIATPPDGMNSDIHASAEYRAHLVGVMAKRAIARAF